MVEEAQDGTGEENQGTEGGREMDGGRGEDEGEDKKGPGGGYDEATEEKTRLHVTSSPEPIWSQSVFHYQKLRRAYTKLYIRDPCKTHRDRANAPGAPGIAGIAHN